MIGSDDTFSDFLLSMNELNLFHLDLKQVEISKSLKK